MHSMALHCMSASRAEQGARSMHSMALHCISAEQGAESMHTGDHAAWQGGSQGAGEGGREGSMHLGADVAWRRSSVSSFPWQCSIAMPAIGFAASC